MEPEALALIALAAVACFAAAGGWVSHLKNRPPLEGFFLGALLGPVGLVVELRRPFAHRPMIDRGAWDSFRSMVDYQSHPDLLCLPTPAAKALPAPARRTAG